MVQIHFDTATYDEIEKDKKITLEAQLGLIGGTMGLLTGFSILSGVEIIYFVFRLFYLGTTVQSKRQKDPLSTLLQSLNLLNFQVSHLTEDW